MTLLFKRLSDSAYVPTKGSQHAVGFDLYAAHPLLIQPGSNGLVKTDIAVFIPEGCYGRIAPRSGLALKQCIDIGGGVIDRDYTGNVGVVVFNHSLNNFTVNKGDKIAQFICEKCEYPELKEVYNLPSTVRGSKGFGSTGV